MAQRIDISTEDFDRILTEILEDTRPEAVLTIPGVYEILAEHYNNDILQIWEAEQADPRFCECEQPVKGPNPWCMTCGLNIQETDQ